MGKYLETDGFRVKPEQISSLIMHIRLDVFLAGTGRNTTGRTIWSVHWGWRQ